ncbi:MAG: hypothetical protein ACP5M9_03200 [Candidatus Micrarchaeia archaeon]
MYKEIRYKVKNGKFFHIKIRFDKKIEAIEIIGDFFIYPDNGLYLIENSLKNLSLDKNLIGDKIKDKIRDKINEIVNKNSIKMIGIDSESIAGAILECI